MSLGLPEDYHRYLTTSLLYLARRLRTEEADTSRRKKMQLAINERQALLESTWNLDEGSMRDLSPLRAAIGEITWGAAAARILLVDTLFANPFAPYSLKYKESDREDPLRILATECGIAETLSEVELLGDMAKDSRKSHRRFFERPGTWAAITVGGVILTGGIGWLAAPAIAGMVGASSGLYGAAATAHGLAVLGGGSLAAGGAGMAGGMAVVTAAGAGVGAITGGGASMLMSMSVEEAVAEVVKTQTTFAFVLLRFNTPAAESALLEMRSNVRTLTAAHKDARTRNDDKSPEVKGAEKRLRAVEVAADWMEKKLDTATR